MYFALEKKGDKIADGTNRGTTDPYLLLAYHGVGEKAEALARVSRPSVDRSRVEHCWKRYVTRLASPPSIYNAGKLMLPVSMKRQRRNR